MKILLLAYYFPPIGGAGTQRSLKFTKYLTKMGHSISVIAGEEQGNRRWSATDQTLASEIPTGVQVHRISLYDRPFSGGVKSSLRRALAMPSEIWTRWVNRASPVAEDLCHKERPDVILASMSPFESSVIADRISSKFEIPWVADLRDPWALDEWQSRPSLIHHLIEERKMRNSLRSAALVVMNTPTARDSLIRRFPEFTEKSVTCITNGYDAEDFQLHIGEIKRNEFFTITHAGALHTSKGILQSQNRRSYRLLGKVKNGAEYLPRSHHYLLKAIEHIAKEDPVAIERIRVKLAGNLTREDLDLIDSSPAKSSFIPVGLKNHDETIAELVHADALFLPLHEVDCHSRATIVPGKTYEYMASGTPIIGALPNGDARDFLEKTPNTYLTKPTDHIGIAQAVLSLFREWGLNSNETIKTNLDYKYVTEFERERLSAKLAQSIQSILKH